MAKHTRLSLVVFIDAFGWELYQRHGFLRDVLPIAQPLQSIIGYSCACDPTIITGKLPIEHGHFSFFQYAPERSPFGLCKPLGLLPKAIASRARVRRYMSRLLQAWLGYTGYFQIYNVPFQYLPLFDYSEKKDIYEAEGLINKTSTIFDLLRRESVRFELSDWRKSESFNIARMKSRIEQTEIEFGYLYLAHLDGLLHAHGTSHAAIEEKIRWYENELRELIRVAESKYGEVHVRVISDHGMHDVTKNVDLQAILRKQGLKFGRDFHAVYDSTMARFWFTNPASAPLIRESLGNAGCGRWLEATDFDEYGINFADHRYGEAMFLMSPGSLIVPSFMNERHVPGMHGYDPIDRDSIALYATNDFAVDRPVRLDDLYSIFARDVRWLKQSPETTANRSGPDSHHNNPLQGEIESS